MISEAFVLIFILIFGVSFGFISSTPLGPINLLIANHYLIRKKLAIVPFVVGIILADVFLAFVAFFGFYKLLEGTKVSAWVGLVGGVLVVAFGIIGIISAFGKEKSAEDVERELPKTAKKISGDFIKGLALCGLNPGLLLFWISIATLMPGSVEYFTGKTVEFNSTHLITVLIGITFGELFWFIFFIKILKYGAQRFGNKVLFYLRIIISAVLVLLGLYLLIFEGISKF